MFDVALMMTSAQLGTATEAFGVPAGASVASAHAAVAPARASADQAAWAALVDGGAPSTPNGGPRPAPSLDRVPLSKVPQLTGSDLVVQLGLLSRSNLDRTLDRHPELIDSLLAHQPSAVENATTWRLLPADARERLVDRAPRLVGNLEGVPYDTRDRANRLDASAEIRQIQARLDGGTGRATSSELRSRLHMLQQVQLALRSTDGIHRELISLDSRDSGTAVISIGDLETADYVSYLVPGMFYGVDERIVPWTGVAADIAVQQRSWLDRLHRTDQHAAVVSWIGYRTPTLVDVASMTDARVGSANLAASLRGLAATRERHHPYVSVLAHSYGATAAMLALQSDGASASPPVDALAMVGSPGSPARSVRDLRVKDGNVWVGAARWDPISQSGVFGSQPTSKEYGARQLGVDGGKDPLTRQSLTGTVSHNDYFTPGSETLRNFALIGIDASPYVLQPGGRMLADGASR